MLPTQIISIPFTGGLDTKSSWPTVNAANFLELENAVFTKTGALKKRWGYESISTNIEADVTRLGTLVGGAAAGSEILAFEQSTAYGFMPSTNGWMPRGNVSSAIVRTTKVSAPIDGTVYGAEVASVGDIRAYAWVQAGDTGQDVWASVVDADGRKYVSSALDTNISTSEPAPKVLVFGGLIYYFWLRGVEIKFLTIRPENPSVGASAVTSLVGDVDAGGMWDITVIGDYLYVGYGGDDGVAPGMYLRRFSTTLVEDVNLARATYPLLGTSPIKAVALVSDWERRCWPLWVSDNGANDVVIGAVENYSFQDAATVTASLDSSVVLDAAGRLTGYVKASSDTLNVLYEAEAAGTVTTVFVSNTTMTSAGVAGTPAVMKRFVGLECRPFVVGTTAYVCLSTGQSFGKTALQPTYFVYDIDHGIFVSKYANLTGRGSREVVRVAEWAEVDPDVFLVPHSERGRLTAGTLGVYAVLGVSGSEIDFASYSRYLTADIDGTILAGGMLQSYDGVSFMEHGPLLFPEGGYVAAVGAGGSLSAGVYQYKMVYEIVDKAGRRRLSAASQAIDLTSAVGSNSVTVNFPVPHVSSDMGNINLVLYRTKAGEDIFFRVWDAENGRLAGLAPDPSVDFVTVTDDVADATIDGHEPLYTTGGYLENISPPSCTTIVSYKGRAVIAGTPEPNRVWFSKLTYPGIAVGFNDQLTIDVDPDGGPITALGVLDDKLIVFKHSRCYFVQGNGPDDTAQGFDFFPQLLSADVGCSEPGSVVAVPGGLMFKSAKGIYAISSGLSVSYVGAPVEAFNSTEIVSATLVPDRDMVLFISATGKAMAFDYAVNKWSTFTNHDGVWSGLDRTTNKLVLFRSSGRVQRQSDSSFTDAGKFIPLKVVTGWLAQGEILGWQRVQRLGILGEYKGNHNLRVRFGYDYLKPYTQEVTIPVSTIITTTTYGTGTYGTETPYGGSYPAERFAVQLKKQKCLSVRVSIEDIQTSGYNEGLVLSGIAFRVGAKAGFNKQSHDRKIGAV